MQQEDSEMQRFSLKESPCRKCTDHRAGCHSPECPHGWEAWHQWQQEQSAKRFKERKLESYYQTIGMRKNKGKAVAKVLHAAQKGEKNVTVRSNTELFENRERNRAAVCSQQNGLLSAGGKNIGLEEEGARNTDNKNQIHDEGRQEKELRVLSPD